MEYEDRSTSIFASGNKFYVWDGMDDEIHEICRMLEYDIPFGLPLKTLEQIGELCH